MFLELDPSHKLKISICQTINFNTILLHGNIIWIMFIQYSISDAKSLLLYFVYFLLCWLTSFNMAFVTSSTVGAIVFVTVYFGKFPWILFSIYLLLESLVFCVTLIIAIKTLVTGMSVLLTSHYPYPGTKSKILKRDLYIQSLCG